MRARSLFAAVAIVVVLPPAGASAVAVPAARMQTSDRLVAHPYAVHVSDAARRFGIPEAWIWAVMRVESGGDARAVSSAGAMGLMQIMPGTWAALRVRHGLGSDPFDVRDNIMAGAAYLREMHDRYGDASAMLAAYNAGPGRYDAYLRGRPLPSETVTYLTRLAPVVGGSTVRQAATAPRPDPLAWRRAGLFVRSASALASPDESFADDDLTTDDPTANAQPDGRSFVDTASVALPLETSTDTLFVRRPSAARSQ